MEIFEVLADPVRREIVERLADGPRTAGELSDAFEISRPAVSRHLRVLREHGVVRSRADAQRRIYSLRREALDEAEGLCEIGRIVLAPSSGGVSSDAERDLRSALEILSLSRPDDVGPSLVDASNVDFGDEQEDWNETERKLRTLARGGKGHLEKAPDMGGAPGAFFAGLGGVELIIVLFFMFQRRRRD